MHWLTNILFRFSIGRNESVRRPHNVPDYKKAAELIKTWLEEDDMNFKDEIESEFKKTSDWLGCTTGDCPHEKQLECYNAVFSYLEALKSNPAQAPSYPFVALSDFEEVQAALVSAEAEAKLLRDFIKSDPIKSLEAEVKLLREALKKCIDGFEGYFGKDFWQSELGNRLIELGLSREALK